MRSRIGLAIVLAVFLGSYIVIWYGTLKLSSDYFESPDRPRTPVSQATPLNMFPLLVVTHTGDGYRAEIVPYSELGLPLDKNQIFRVPLEEVEGLNRQLAATGENDYPGSFTVRELADGRQLLTVRYTWRGGMNRDIGCYVTDGTHFTPKFYDRYMQGGIEFFAVPVFFAANTVIWVVGSGVYLLVRHIVRRRRGSRITE
jgi:hypothetical protein